MANYHRDYTFLMDNHYYRKAEVIAEAISGLTFPAALQAFTFVDVGSHVGKLTKLVLENLVKKHPSVEVNCIEPDTETFDILRSNLKHPDISFYNTNFQDWLRDHTDALSDSVDLLVNSHTFYHYPESSWSEIIEKTDQLLGQYGKHVIIIDSAKSSLSEIKPVLDDKIPGETHDTFGRFLVGSDLESNFTSAGIKYTRKDVQSPIYFKDDEQALDLVCHMLGFVIRYNPADVKKYAGEEIKDFIAQHREGGMIVLPRNQDFFVLPKQ